MASGKAFPSEVQTLTREGKLLTVAFAPNGASTPAMVVGASQGIASVARNSAGNFTLTLQDSYCSLVGCQAEIQLASPPTASTASHTWTDTTDSNSVQFLAGSNFPGALGNNLKVVVATGAALANTVTWSAGITTVTITIDTTVTTPALLKTYVNTTAAGTLGGTLTIGTTSGTTAFTVFLASTALTGGASNVLTCQLGAIDVTLNKTVVVQILDASTGLAVDMTGAAGNQVNIELFLKNSNVGG